MGSLIGRDRPRIATIETVEQETPTVRSFLFKDRLTQEARPAQFVMVWVPGVDEIPMSVSVSREEGGYAALTVRGGGPSSRVLYEKKAGDLIGIRGPYGKGFSLSRGHVLLVGGGTGVAPLARLAKELAPEASKITAIIGARTKAEVIFLDYFRRILPPTQSDIVVTTDDGTYGIKGSGADAVELALKRERVDMIYSCGPEGMVKRIFLAAKKEGADMQASVERSMKCGIGLCGSCCIGKYILCSDGPVLSKHELEEVSEELGSIGRDATGRRIRFG